MKDKIYPESGIELSPFISRHYDRILAIGSLGRLHRSIKEAIEAMNIQAEDQILDMGCGTGLNAQHMLEYLKTKGGLQGMDISEEMALQFQKRFQDDERVRFVNQRIDQPFQLDRKFDKVFMSFVIHGFPHEVRQVIIQNALEHLKTGGSLFILDYSEFELDAMPWLHRAIFKAVECKYAFDFIKRDWKSILKEQGFRDFKEHYYLKKYMRLLEAVKN
jgi:demethylmenaquinone methyltransferase/2-methoxy-6-polyprenyl-1,4-benzoquinol methylase